MWAHNYASPRVCLSHENLGAYHCTWSYDFIQFMRRLGSRLSREDAEKTHTAAEVLNYDLAQSNSTWIYIN